MNRLFEKRLQFEYQQLRRHDFNCPKNTSTNTSSSEVVIISRFYFPEKSQTGIIWYFYFPRDTKRRRRRWQLQAGVVKTFCNIVAVAAVKICWDSNLILYCGHFCGCCIFWSVLKRPRNKAFPRKINLKQPTHVEVTFFVIFHPVVSLAAKIDVNALKAQRLFTERRISKCFGILPARWVTLILG